MKAFLNWLVITVSWMAFAVPASSEGRLQGEISEPPVFCAVPLTDTVIVSPDKTRYSISYNNLADGGACPALGDATERPGARNVLGVELVIEDIVLPENPDFTFTIGRGDSRIELTHMDFEGNEVLVAPFVKSRYRVRFQLSGTSLPSFTVKSVIRPTTEKERSAGLQPFTGSGYDKYSRLNEGDELVLKAHLEPLRIATVFLRYDYPYGPRDRLEEKCSGFLVGKKEILTNRHCLDQFAAHIIQREKHANMTGQKCNEIKVYFDVVHFNQEIGERLPMICEMVVGQNVDQDWAVLRLKSVPPHDGKPRIPLFPARASENVDAVMLHYWSGVLHVADECSVLRGEKNQVVLDIIEVEQTTTLNERDTITVHECHTGVGGSGSAVVLRDSLAVVGLHFGAYVDRGDGFLKREERFKKAVLLTDDSLGLSYGPYNLSRNISSIWTSIDPILTK